jgi:tRNA(His) 5'-end guanylyltransferase
MNSKDPLGDRMKAYEAVETERKFDITKPIYARIDGRSFSKFTKKMDRPFDIRMTNAMIETTKYLVESTHANMGYVQSDEISLVWDGKAGNGDAFFGGKIQKQCSVLASMAASKFSLEYFNQFGNMTQACPHFDCRVIQMPDRTEATNMMLWRELDARKNSVSMLAQHYYSHKELQGKGQADMIEMLAAKSVNLDDHPTAFSRGSWIRRIVEDRVLTADERAAIPEKHRPSETTIVQCSKIVVVDMPKFNTVANREEVIFDGALPT